MSPARLRDMVPARVRRMIPAPIKRRLKQLGKRRTPELATDRPTEHYDALLGEIARLPMNWHMAGVCADAPLRAMALYAPSPVVHSAETGCGKSTLLLSHLSGHHTVFCLDDHGISDSLAKVRASPLLRSATTDFVLGPTQRTLPHHTFAHSLQFVLIDGPHGYPFPELEYYFLYPHLEPGALLVIDDIHIPSIFRLFAFVREDAMFNLLGVVDTTAFFRRNGAPTFDATGDGWWLQNYNRTRFPIDDIDRDFVSPTAGYSAEFRRLVGED